MMRWATGFLLAALALGTAGAQPSPPSVIVIMTDDMGYGDIGPYGVVDIRTPHLDRLSREGVTLTDAYANGANCSPTRAGFITGRYQQRVGFDSPLDPAHHHERGLPVTGASLPALVKTQGYATGLIGKWHLGFTPEFGPNAHGFDEFFGVLAGAVDFYSHRRGDGTPDLYENTTPVTAPGYLTDEITTRSVAFVERHAGAPFFLTVSYTAPHWPFQPPDRRPADPMAVPSPNQTSDFRLRQWPDDPVPATREDYVRMVERVDEGVGQILAALDRRDLARDTLVIFTNDNGGEWLSRNDPFSHHKSTLWEGGIRVPLIVRWPGRLPAGATSPQVAITMDLTASILSVAGVPRAEQPALDGIDVLPLLAEGVSTVERRLFWRISTRRMQQKAVRDGRWKLLIDDGQSRLFDLAADPGEQHNLAAAHPERVRALTAAVHAWEQEMKN